MPEFADTTLAPGDLAPDFELPGADAQSTVGLAEYLRRGPVLLAMLRGLYCPFCRRHISQLKPASEALRSSGIALLGIVIASPERARQYFTHFPPSFPMATASDRALHRAYGLPEVARTDAMRHEVERLAGRMVRELGLQASAGEAVAVLKSLDGFRMTGEDLAESERPLQTVGCFLIGQDGRVRWSRVDVQMIMLPATHELLAFL
jgi:peroxiredoxin